MVSAGPSWGYMDLEVKVPVPCDILKEAARAQAKLHTPRPLQLGPNTSRTARKPEKALIDAD